MSIGWLIALFVLCAILGPVMFGCSAYFEEQLKYGYISDEILYVLCSIISFIFFGFAVFFAAKLFCNLSISYWWLLLSPVWFVVAVLLPGAFTLTNWIFSSILGVMQAPLWVYIVGIVFDIIGFIRVIYRIAERKKSKKDVQ